MSALSAMVGCRDWPITLSISAWTFSCISEYFIM
uniref:Uncharacterized protein n=1 Tax=Anguilla anguilla TaxID=7936 RepID=A0A0E9Q4Z5_ANGAN